MQSFHWGFFCGGEGFHVYVLKNVKRKLFPLMKRPRSTPVNMVVS